MRNVKASAADSGQRQDQPGFAARFPTGTPRYLTKVLQDGKIGTVDRGFFKISILKNWHE
jgi:hypothetical protein